VKNVPYSRPRPLFQTPRPVYHGAGTCAGQGIRAVYHQKKGRVIKKVPAIKVDQIMIFGNAQVTSQAMQFCILEKIPVFLLSGQGRYYGVIDGFDTDPVLLHRDQFRCADDPGFCLALARQFVCGKIANCRVMLLRLKRRRNPQPLGKAALDLKAVLARLAMVTTLDELRGLEGTAARIYFSTLARVIDADWQFLKRTKQPPRDPINSMLSYGYTLLFYNLYSLLRTRGLNPHVGFLHPVRQGHPALVSDVIEEFRAIVVDAVVLNLAMNRRLTPEQFTTPAQDGEPCLLDDAARTLFVRELEKKLNSRLTHPRTGLSLDYRRCMEHQVRHLAAVIQGREERYVPLVLK
jgi:CRISPR-associated protein Cas1